MTDVDVSTNPALERVMAIMTRSVEFNPLDAFQRAMQPITPSSRVSGKIALGFDTNAIFRVANGKKGADTVDFFDGPFDGKLILPGQVVQEVWNNQLSGISPTGKIVQQKFDELEQEAAKIDVRFGGAGDSVKDAISNLVALHAHTSDSDALKAFHGLVEVFTGKADVPFVPRTSFHELAQVRRATRTPPGFKDQLLGDFFVWADFLYGVVRAGAAAPLEGVAFVTMDQKADWSRNGAPHPILVAEAEMAANAPFQLWAITDLYDYVSSESGIGP